MTCIIKWELVTSREVYWHITLVLRMKMISEPLFANLKYFKSLGEFGRPRAVYLTDKRAANSSIG